MSEPHSTTAEPDDQPIAAASTAPGIVAKSLSFMRQHWGKGLLLIVAVIIAALAGPRYILGPQVAVSVVVQRDFVQSVVASGRVETPHRVNIGVQITGTVLTVPVNEGQQVRADTLLIELESSELQATVSQAQRAVQSAIAQQRQLSEVQIPMAQQTLREAQANEAAALQVLERSRTLFSRDLLSQAALDEAIRAEQVTRSKVSGLSAQLKSLQQNGSQQALADTALHQAQAGLALAQARLAYTQLTAPVAGVLISRNVEPGDVVQPGKTLMQLSPATQTQLVVQIEEKNLHLIQLQQPALASADAYAQARFNAELVYINPGVDAQRGSVEVKLLVAEPPDYLRQDMTVSVDIEVARRSNAVLVASDAIHGADQQIPWVFKLEGRQVRKTNVKLGLRSQGWTEVLEGLKAGDQVIPISPIPISDGLNIRVLPSIAQAKS